MLTVDFEQFPLAAGDRLLDLGCGVGRHAITAYMLENVASVGIDLCWDDLQTAKQRFEAEFEDQNSLHKQLILSAADGQALPFADRSFDKVICSEVLEHIPDYRKVLQEIYRVLKPQGRLAVSVPRFGPEWICWRLSRQYHNEKGGHIRIFRAAKLRLEIEKQGFLFLKRHWAHALHVPYWWLQCIFWSKREQSKLIKAYHRLLVWDLLKKPRLTQTMDRLLNPLMGKSVVMYFTKE